MIVYKYTYVMHPGRLGPANAGCIRPAPST